MRYRDALDGRFVLGDLHDQNGNTYSWDRVCLYWQGWAYELEPNTDLIPPNHKIIPINRVRRYFKYTTRMYRAQISSGLIAISDRARWPIIPDVPKFIETLDIELWNSPGKDDLFIITRI